MSSNFVPFGKTVARSLVPEGADITEYKSENLHQGKGKSYTHIKSTFDPATKDKIQNSRFTLSELVSGQLSVEEDERRRFEKKVTDTVAIEINRVRESVLTQARADGFEAGRKEAYDQEKVKLAAAIEGMLSLVKTLQKAKVELATQYENQLVEITFRLAKLVVNNEIQERPAVVTGTIVEILNRISKDDDVVFKIGHHEYVALEQIKEELSDIARNGRIHFELSETLKDGDCIVESMSGEIASFIELKFEKLHDALFSKDLSKTSKAESSPNKQGTGT